MYALHCSKEIVNFAKNVALLAPLVNCFEEGGIIFDVISKAFPEDAYGPSGMSFLVAFSDDPEMAIDILNQTIDEATNNVDKAEYILLFILMQHRRYGEARDHCCRILDRGQVDQVVYRFAHKSLAEIERIENFLAAQHEQQAETFQRGLEEASFCEHSSASF